MPDRHGSRDDRLLAVHAVLVHRETRDDRNFVADREADHAFADGINHARGLITEPGRKRGLLKIRAAAKHGLRSIQTERVHAQPQFARAGRADIYLVDLQNLRAANPVKSNHACHRLLLMRLT